MTKKKRKSGGGFGTVTSCISTTLVLILLGGAVLLVTMARNFSDQVRSEMPVAVLLKDSIPAKERIALQRQLQRKPYVNHVAYVSKEQGAKETCESMQMQPGEFITDNPILAEFELSLKGEYTNKDSIQRIAPQLKANPYVADVVYPIEEIDNLNRAIPVIGTVLLAVAALLAFVTFALISNAIRMNIYARRFIIHTMKMVGARWSFIRRPFMWQAFGIGLTSATIADGLIGAGIWYVRRMDVYTSSLITVDVVVPTLGSVIVCGLVLTLICAYFSVNKYLRMRSGEIFLR